MQNESDRLDPRDDKREVLLQLFRLIHGGAKATGKMREYLDALRSVPVEELRPACEMLRETWAELHAPLPGNIRAASAKFARKSGADVESEKARQRMELAEANRVTPEIARNELARVHDIPLPEDEFERRVEVSRRAGLERYLDIQEGRTPSPGGVGLLSGHGAGKRSGQGDPQSLSSVLGSGEVVS